MNGKYICIGTFKEGISFNYCRNEFTCKARKIFNLCKIIILNKFQNKNLLDKEILRIYKKLIIG